MRETDAFSWSMESDPRLRMPVTAVALLDATPDWDEVTARLDRVTRVAPMFRQRIVSPPGHLAPPKWVVDARFELSSHIYRVLAPPPASLEGVLGFAAQLGSTAFDPMRPMWEAWFVDGLSDGRAALVVKVHHTLTDGIGGVQLLAHLFDVDGRPLTGDAVPAPPPPGDPGMLALLRSSIAHDVARAGALARSSGGAVVRTLRAARHGPLDAVRGALATWGSAVEVLAPTRERLSPVMTGRGLTHHYAGIDVPLDGLRRAARAVAGTVNDAYLTGITGGLRRYHELHGSPVRELRVVLPINTREPGDVTPGGNRMALIRYVLPLVPADPVPRMAEIKSRTEHWKNAPAMAYIEGLYGAVNTLPTSYLQGLAMHNDAVASNVPGFPMTVRLAGPRLVAFYPFGPTGGTAVNITLMSYADTCHIGVNADACAVRDMDAFVACLRAGFQEVLAAATEGRRRAFPA